jgi:hypothetical protein
MELRRKLLTLISVKQEIAEERLKNICSKSNRLNYKEMLNKIVDIIGDVEIYNLSTYINVLAEELEENKKINKEDWDLTEEQLLDKYNNMKYWEENYKLYGEKDLYKDALDFKENMLYWFVERSLTGALASVKDEYNSRKKIGLC